MLYWRANGVELHQGDALAVLKELASESVQCAVTSPPFFHLRDYGCEGQIGLEPTLAEYIGALVDVFREVRRVLRRDGTLWLECGDCYTGGRGGGWKGDEHGQQHKEPIRELGPKQLLGVPWRLAFALQDDGWVLRRDIVWHKVNCLPESVRDRPTCSHSFVFLFAKSQRYYWDAEAVKELSIDPPGVSRGGSLSRFGPEEALVSANAHRGDEPYASSGTRNLRDVWSLPTEPLPTIAGIDHFAAFPTALAERCILASTSAKGCCPVCGAPWERVVSEPPIHGPAGVDYKDNGAGRGQRSFKSGSDFAAWQAQYPTQTLGWRPTCNCPGAYDDSPEYVHEPVPCVVLDPFSGAGTTLLVANRLGRRAVGIELNPAYCEMSKRRIVEDAPLLNGVEV